VAEPARHAAGHICWLSAGIEVSTLIIRGGRQRRRMIRPQYVATGQNATRA
jgi:hypothetical protein